MFEHIRGLVRPACRAAAAALPALCALLLGAPPSPAAVPPGDFCVVGTGNNTSTATDGWVATVTAAGVVTPEVVGAPLIDPWDCAVDPTNGDIIVVDEGPNGAGVDGVIYRVVTGAPTTITPIPVAPLALVNPRGLTVGTDGTIYVTEMGASFAAGSNDGAIYAVPPVGLPFQLDTAGVVLANPVDADIDPRPFTGLSAGVNLVILEFRLGALVRVPIAGGAVVAVAPGPGGNRWEGIEVGPYGSYFMVDHVARSVERYSRFDGSRQQIATGGVLNRPWGITVDYFSGDLVVADRNAGVANVPAAAYLAGAVAPSTIAAPILLPGARASGIGFSPPLADANPSANFGMPTRRAPIPGTGPFLIGPDGDAGWGDVENQMDFFIEVGDTSSPLRVQLFDINMRDSIDRVRGTNFATRVVVTLFDPAGGVVATNTLAANGRVDLDQRIVTLDCPGMPGTPCSGGGNPSATFAPRGVGIDLGANAEGLYQLQILLPDDATTDDDDYNAFGVWVEDFHAYLYAPTYGANNTTGAMPRYQPLDSYRFYPYVDRGCEATISNWDWDFNVQPGTNATVTTRLGDSFNPTLSFNSSEHAETALDPTPTGAAARSSSEVDYGLWRYSPEVALDLTLGNNNFVTERFPDFNGWADGGGINFPVPVPVGNPAANPTPTLATSPAPAYPQEPFGAATNNYVRFYLARYDETPDPATPDSATGGARPYAPYLMHSATPLSGDPPVNGGPPAYYAIQVTVVNPDPVNALGTVAITAPVPAPGQFVTTGPNVAGGPTVTGGTGGVAGSSCAAPCSGDVTASWTSIGPGESATLSYAMNISATAAGQTLFLGEGPRFRGGGITPAVNAAPPIPKPPVGTAMGTRATFVPAWQSTTFARSESLGPLCELAVVEGVVTPNAVDLADFEAIPGDGEVLVVWETAAEFENLGFWLYRRLEGEQDFTRVNPWLIFGQGTTDLTARYALWDRDVPNGVAAEYILEDIEIDGDATSHGPVSATPTAGAPTPSLDPEDYAIVAEVTPESDVHETGAGTGAGGAGGTAGVAADTGSFRVLAREADSILVEVRVPPIETGAVAIDGTGFTSVSAAGYGPTLVSGLPELPARSFWLEAPDATVVEIELLERDGDLSLLDAPVLPVATTWVDAGDPVSARVPEAAAYASSAPYPAEHAVLAGSVPNGPGSRLLSLRVQPARWTATTGALETSERLLLRIHLGGPMPLASGAAPDADIQAVASLDGVRIAAAGPGLVRVDGDALTAAGLDPDVDPRLLHLFRNGVEVAVRFEGEWDGRLDPGDALLFWSEGRDTRYAGEEVFQLVAGDTGGLRAGTWDGAPTGLMAPPDADAHGRFEEQDVYLPTILNGEDDNYVGDFVFSAPIASTVPTPAAGGAEAALRVRLRGGTTFEGVEPDHHHAIEIDGVEVMDAVFDGTELFDAMVILPLGMVISDNTEVTVVPQFDAAMPHLDLVYVDALEIFYRRTLELRPADAGRLLFTADVDGTYVVTGLDPGDGLRVWDVTDPDAPVVVENTAFNGNALAFDGATGASYAVVQDPGLVSPAELGWSAGSAWTAGGGADWLAIAHSSLLEGAEALAAHRASQGLSTAVVDVADVFDETTGGVATPVAIRDFLRTVSASWDPAPRYVVLVGDANYDYRNFLAGSAPNLVPTMLLDTTFVEAASDSWFGTSDDESVAPGVAVGRIPVQTPAELDAVVAKLIGIDAAASSSTPSPWQQALLLVADDGLHDGQPVEAELFEAIAEAFRAELSPGYDTQRVYLTGIPEGPEQGDVAHEQIVEAVETGVAVALYGGHGGPKVWADELVLTDADVPDLENAERLPLVIALNCLNGFFDAPNEEALAETALLAPDDGAAAFISSTTVSALAGQEAFARALAERLGRGNVRIVGDAMQQAQQAIAATAGAEDVLRTWVLIGDPATRLALRQAPLADAGQDVDAETGEAVVLDGTGSDAPGAGPLSYAWRVVDEPVAGAGLLDAPDTAQPTFRALIAGTYVVELVVHDGALPSVPATVVVNATGASPLLGCAPQDGTLLDAVWWVLPVGAGAARHRSRRTRTGQSSRHPASPD